MSTSPLPFQVDANSDVAIGNGKTIFHFGYVARNRGEEKRGRRRREKSILIDLTRLQSGTRFPVDKEMYEDVELTNNSNNSVSYVPILHPSLPLQIFFD